MKKIFLFTLLCLSVILLGACSLASSAPTAPVANSNPSAAQPVSQPLQLPGGRPNVANGAAIYANKCVQCHGTQGLGDGPRAAEVKAQTGTPPADITSDPIARAQSPQQWFDTITNGRIDKLMPPFGPSLSVDDRWDVIAYIWTLAAPSSDVAQGKATYGTLCVQCHGETGKGDGPQATGKLPDFSQFSTFATIPIGQWDQALTTSHVPSFAGQLNTLEQREVNDYVRTFAVDQSVAPTVSATPSAPSSTSTGTVTATSDISTPAASTVIEGYIVNGTAGQAVPANSPVNIYILHSDSSIVSQTVQADATGHFVVLNLAATHGDAIYGEVVYKNLNFFNGPVAYGLDLTATLPITVYESTLDISNIKVDALHVVIMTNTLGLNVTEIYILSNTGDRYVAGFGQPILHFSLPKGATSISPDPNMPANTLISQGDGVDYYDAVPVGSQVSQIIFQYQMAGHNFTLDRPLPHDIGLVNVLIQGDTNQLHITSSQLADQGPQTIQGAVYQTFSGQNLKAGDNLAIQVDVALPAAPTNWPMIIGLGLIVLGVVGIVVWQVQQRKAKTAPQQASKKKSAAKTQEEDDDTDALIDQIAALDDQHAAGKIADDIYTAKRAQLKKKLMKLMSEE